MKNAALDALRRDNPRLRDTEIIENKTAHDVLLFKRGGETCIEGGCESARTMALRTVRIQVGTDAMFQRGRRVIYGN